MEKAIMFFLAATGCSLFSAAGWALDAAPVSPALEGGAAVVGACRPTFSWSPADGAEAHEVMVFEASEGETPACEDMAALYAPVLAAVIPGAASSWTPSSETCLSHDRTYVWCVRGAEPDGSGAWSQGNRFTVDLEPPVNLVRETLDEALTRYFSDEEAVARTFSELETRVARTVTERVQAGDVVLQGSEGDAKNNTYYGYGAGTSLSEYSENNVFVGRDAGKSTYSGDHNTLLGMYAGRDNFSGSRNTFVGQMAGEYNTFGDDNTFIGRLAGASNKQGSDNAFLGSAAGVQNTGSENTFVGTKAGTENTDGRDNTFLGFSAGGSNRSSSKNTFLGHRAGFSNTTGSENTFVGQAAGESNAGGAGNTFFGQGAGSGNTTGSDNTFLAFNAGFANTTGDANTFLGQSAGGKNTTGWWNTFLGSSAGHENTLGDTNTFVGRQAGYSNTEGSSNVFVGPFAGWKNNTGYYNTFLGRETGYNTGNGYWNTFLGSHAGHANTSGSANTCVGMGAGFSNTEGHGNVFIGTRAGYGETGSNRLYIASTDTPHPLIYGEFDTGRVRINGTLEFASGYAVSDARFKTGVQPLKRPLDLILGLQGVSYAWNTAQYPGMGFEEGRHIGLIAQETEKVLPEVVRTGRDGQKAVSYDQIVPVLIGAVKEQQAMIQAQQGRIEELQSMVRALAGG